MVVKTLPPGPSTQYLVRNCGQIREHAHAPFGAAASPTPSDRMVRAMREFAKIVDIGASSAVFQAGRLFARRREECRSHG
jgi:hypothetical protein